MSGILGALRAFDVACQEYQFGGTGEIEVALPRTLYYRAVNEVLTDIEFVASEITPETIERAAPVGKMREGFYMGGILVTPLRKEDK